MPTHVFFLALLPSLLVYAGSQPYNLRRLVSAPRKLQTAAQSSLADQIAQLQTVLNASNDTSATPAPPPAPPATPSPEELAELAKQLNPMPTKKEEVIIEREFGNKLTPGSLSAKWFVCQSQVETCGVGAHIQRMALIFEKIRTGINSCIGQNCEFDQAWCNLFWEDIDTNVETLSQFCIAQGDWPPSCTQMLVTHKEFIRKPEFEMRVMCEIIQPGGIARWGRIHTPTCSDLAMSMMQYHTTLGSQSFDDIAASRGCALGADFGDRNECINHFCAIKNEFRWRMRPRNLQKLVDSQNLSTYWPEDFVLPGCEDVARQNYTAANCPLREDVHAMCDCLCPNFRKMPISQPAYECALNVDTHLMFGRFRVDGLRLEPFCEDSLCSLLSANRQQCPRALMPDMTQCKALQLADTTLEACPWQNHSGENGVLECLDGHRCRPDEESWTCCFAHKGRGRCPKDQPTMCNTLCGGGAPTEFCCEALGPGNVEMCSPRPCSPMLVPFEITVPPTTPPPSTSELPYKAAPDEGDGLSMRLPPGSWVWLMLIIPFFLGLICIYVWWRAHKAAQWIDVNVEGAKTDAEPTADRHGPFHIVRRPEASEEVPNNRKTLVKIVFDELPLSRPLGVELNECKVMRVHAHGAKYGFQVGDTIVSVAGIAVDTFEGIWQKIQIERDRCPCEFMVERECLAPTFLDTRGQLSPKPVEDKPPEMPSRIERVVPVESKVASSFFAGIPSIHPARAINNTDLNSHKLHGPDAHERMHSATHSASGGSRTSSRDEHPHAVPSLRHAGFAALDEEEENYEHFHEAFPSSQEWWAEYGQRARLHSENVAMGPGGVRLDSDGQWSGTIQHDNTRVSENRRTIELNAGVRPHVKKADLKKAMEEHGVVEDCDPGTYNDSGRAIQPAWVRFKTVMGTDAAMSALKTGTVRLVDETKVGKERFSVLRGEIKKERMRCYGQLAHAHFHNSERIMENRRTVELTAGVRPHFKKEDLKKVMAAHASVEDCHVGIYDAHGHVLEPAWVRFQTVMGLETAITALQTGTVHMLDDTKHGEERWPVLRGERKQDRTWHVPCGVPGSRPAGAKKPILPGDENEVAERPDSSHAFGEWWLKEESERSEYSDDLYSTSESWSEQTRTPKKALTTWEEARLQDVHDLRRAFEQTKPYGSWLAQSHDHCSSAHRPASAGADDHVLSKEEIGNSKEWVCSVCRRTNSIQETNCEVCHESRKYPEGAVRNASAARDEHFKKLERAAKGRFVVPCPHASDPSLVIMEGGVCAACAAGGVLDKKPKSEVRFKEDAWHRKVAVVGA